MLGFIDMAHPLLLGDPERREQHLGRRLAVAQRLQALAGRPCLYQHYRSITPAFVQQWGLQALVLSGIPSHWRQYDWAEFAGLKTLLCEGTMPILGVCGGAQVIGKLLGAPVLRIGRLPAHETTETGYMPGWRKEWGFLPLDLLTADPLLAGLPPHPELLLAHGRALKALPPSCTLLASRPTCQVQIFRLDGTRIYGVQAHPELYTPEYPAGRTLLHNFFTLAGLHPPPLSAETLTEQPSLPFAL